MDQVQELSDDYASAFNHYGVAWMPHGSNLPVSCHSPTHVYVHWYDHIVSCLWWNHEQGRV